MNAPSPTTRQGVDRQLRIAHAAMKTHGKSFSFASLALPRKLRDDTAAIYAYCRRADDAIDLVSPDEARAALERLEAELADIYAGVPQTDPVLAAFADVVERRAVPRHYPSELLAGMRMDVEHTPYESLNDLLTYCYRVAGTVGLMMCHVFGVVSARAKLGAAHLGIAMQLTNVCRDVHEDWLRGRNYLPRSVLGNVRSITGCQASLSAREHTFPQGSVAAHARATKSLLAVADEFYAKGEQAIRYLRFRPALAVRTARLVYAHIGRIVESRGADPRLPRAFVPLGTKLGLAFTAILRTLLEPRCSAPGPCRVVEVDDVLRG